MGTPPQSGPADLIPAARGPAESTAADVPSLDTMTRPAMTDVGRFAGVSHMTVSRVLNGAASVRPETRARVLAAIERLGYRRNITARALATGRSQTLGVVTIDTTLYGPASTLYGIERAARAEGYFVSIVSLRSIDRASIREAVGRLVDQRVDGVILVVPLVSAADALKGLAHDIPLVAVEGDLRADIPVVTVDQVDGARKATEHLLALGHRTVWHVAGPTDWTESHGRLRGWRDTLAKAGADVPPPLSGDWSALSGYEAGRRLSRMPDVTAVFVANDQMALGLLRALSEHGRGVPSDISVVGFDDIPEAAFFSPPLTTVRQNFGLVGRNGLRLMIEQLDTGMASTMRVVIESRLVPRQSSAAARSQ
jgi:DNA-binding LacI/PurR family transcriptional regulator